MPKTLSAVRKTFADGEVLTAADVNAGLNPAQAPHIPYAVAAGTVDIAFAAAQAAEATVTFPAGRFTTVPVITASVIFSASQAGGATPAIHTMSATGCKIRLQLTASATVTIAVSWVAVQMDF